MSLGGKQKLKSDVGRTGWVCQEGVRLIVRADMCTKVLRTLPYRISEYVEH